MECVILMGSRISVITLFLSVFSQCVILIGGKGSSEATFFDPLTALEAAPMLGSIQ